MLVKRHAEPSKKWVIRSEDQRLVEGIIYAPYQLDTYNTMMLPEDIIRMCNDFNTNRMYFAVDHEHDEKDSGCEIIRNWIAGANDPDGYPEGAWVGITKVHNDLMWDMVKRGEINGYSIHCFAGEVKFSGIVNYTRTAAGTTENASDCKILPDHAHEVTILFRKDGSVVSTKTSVALGHSHDVFYATSTETAFEHSHSLVLK